MDRLKQRRDFLRVAQGKSWAAHGVVVQYLKRHGPDNSPRIGFTVTRRLGNAVIRNRIRRRLKEAVRQLPVEIFQNNADYVFIGRQGTEQRPFTRLIGDLRYAIDKLNTGQSQNRAQRKKRSHHANAPVQTKNKTNMGNARS